MPGLLEYMEFGRFKLLDDHPIYHIYNQTHKKNILTKKKQMNNLPAALLRQVHGLLLQDHRLFFWSALVVVDRVVNPGHPGDAAAAPLAERVAAAGEADHLSGPRATLHREHPIPRPRGVRGGGGGEHGCGGAGSGACFARLGSHYWRLQKEGEGKSWVALSVAMKFLQKCSSKQLLGLEVSSFVPSVNSWMLGWGATTVARSRTLWSNPHLRRLWSRELAK